MKDPKDIRPHFTALVDGLGGRYTWTVPPNYAARYVQDAILEVSGVEVLATPLVGSKGALRGVTFTVPTKTPLPSLPVVVRREGGVDRFGKGLGINREFQCGDPAFDDAVYIESDAPDETVAQLLGGSMVRSRIVEMVTGIVEEVRMGPAVALGTRVFDARRGCVQAAVLTSHFEDRTGLQQCLSSLVELASSLDESVGPGMSRPYRNDAARPGTFPEARAPTRLVRGIAATAFAIATWVTAFVLSPPPTVGWRAFLIGGGFGAVAWVVSFLGFGALFRGRSDSLRTAGLLTFLALGLLPCGGRVGEILNAMLDHGPHTTTRATIRMEHSKEGRHPVVVLGGNKLIVERDMVQDLKWSESAPMDVAVELGGGALGSQWVVALRVP